MEPRLKYTVLTMSKLNTTWRQWLAALATYVSDKQWYQLDRTNVDADLLVSNLGEEEV